MPEQETVGNYLHRWLECKQGQLRPRTYTSYEHIVRAHLVPGLGRVRLAKLAPHDVAAWLRRHQKNGASARTARYARSVLRAALNQALRWELVSRNAAALTDPPRYRAREIQPLTPAQARTLLDAVAGHRLEALISVGLGLGLRLGEALGLRWDAVDLEAAPRIRYRNRPYASMADLLSISSKWPASYGRPRRDANRAVSPWQESLAVTRPHLSPSLGCGPRQDR